MRLNLTDFINKLTSIRSWDQFVYFFEHQPLPIQIFIGLVIFGVTYLVYLFFMGLFSDNHE